MPAHRAVCSRMHKDTHTHMCNPFLQPLVHVHNLRLPPSPNLGRNGSHPFGASPSCFTICLACHHNATTLKLNFGISGHVKCLNRQFVPMARSLVRPLVSCMAACSWDAPTSHGKPTWAKQLIVCTPQRSSKRPYHLTSIMSTYSVTYLQQQYLPQALRHVTHRRACPETDHHSTTTASKPPFASPSSHQSAISCSAEHTAKCPDVWGRRHTSTSNKQRPSKRNI